MSILIVGGGSIGTILAHRLAGERKDVVIIEVNEERVRALREAVDVQVVHGSGSSVAVLREAGLDGAEMLIAVADSDEVNLVACMVASKAGVVPVKIARVRDPDLAEVVPQLFDGDSLDLIINPEREAAKAIVNLLAVPGASGVLEFADGRVQVVSFAVGAGCDAVGVVLADLKPKLGVDCNIVALQRDSRLLVPDGRTQILAGDTIHAAGSPEALRSLAALLGKQGGEARHIVISGGGNVTYYLARMLEERELAPKIIEPDTERCKYLVDRLKRSVVLQGEGTDPELLREENVADADAFLALTADEEENVLSALLARRSGAARVVALVNKLSYTSLVTAIGIDAVVSPNLAAVSAILHFIRRGKVVSVTTVGEEAAEALEIVALETSELVGRPLREAGLRDAVVGAIVRGDSVIIPDGEDMIQVGDHVVIFALRSAIPDLERKMMVKLQYF